MADWVASVAGRPPEDPCRAEVEVDAVRLEREADNWRAAAVVAARRADGALAGRLCGPPADFFLLGRQDLADVVRPLLDRTSTGSDRRAALCALVVSASGATDPAEVEAWVSEIEAIEAASPTGLGGLMRWLTLAWRRAFDDAVDVCMTAADDTRLRPATRELFVGIAVLDHFSLTDGRRARPGLVERALAVAERSPVALTRVTCRLGVAWAMAPADPEESLRLVRGVLADVDRLPALTRVTLPGSASRLLTLLDPRLAAQGLLEQFDARPAGPSAIDLVPRCYAAVLLDRLGDPMAAPALAALAVPPTGPTSMMDFVDLARRAAREHDRAAVVALDADLRAALARAAADVGGTAPSASPAGC